MSISSDFAVSPSSRVFLPESSALRRKPLAPNRRRSRGFHESFEDRALVYDCFWDLNGQSIIVVGPPALNLEAEWRNARWTAAGRSLKAELFPSRSTQLTVLAGVPAGCREVEFEFAGARYVVPVQHNEATHFEGRNVLVTMNKDNDLAWIAAWAKWHVQMHGAEGCLFFDNGSTCYSPDDIIESLRSAGITLARVLSWPQKYGRKDPAVLDRPHYPHFLQVSSLNVALRRFAGRANAILNCDIDELVSAQDGSVFDAARTSPQGIVTLKGNWIETAQDKAPATDIMHLDYRYTHRLALLSRCANKWALDPSREWVANPAAKPSVHRIYDLPKSTSADAPVRQFWHFKAINTGWKEDRVRRSPPSFVLKRVAALDADAALYKSGHQAAME